MQCPSCGHSQHDSLECERCGIIFEKYRKRQEHLASEKETSANSSDLQQKSVLPLLLLTLFVGLGIGGGSFYYLSGAKIKPSTPVLQEEITTESRVPSGTNENHVSQQRQVVKPRSPRANTKNELEGLALQLAERFPARTGIEIARNATVFIETPWGSGSGFFVSPNGHIITNRHVLKMKDAELDKLKANADKGAKALVREAKSLRYLKGRIPQIRDREMRQQVKEDVRARERKYSKYKHMHAKLLDRLATIENASPREGVKVVLVDGSEYMVNSVMMSDNADLALLSIDAWGAPYLAASKLSRAQGQKVYAVGNPRGLRHSVTSGIISGYRTYDGQPMIQTDAPINPGNSGGPLIDEDGGVIGVNTMIIRNTEGIGFAIPMRTLFDEYGNYISTE